MNQEQEPMDQAGQNGRSRKVLTLESVQTPSTTLKTSAEYNRRLQEGMTNMYQPSPMLKTIEKGGKMEKIEHDFSADAVRIGWALLHFTIVSIFLAGLYLCVAVWRVSSGRSFKITAPIVWDKPMLPEILGDADGMDEPPTRHKNNAH